MSHYFLPDRPVDEARSLEALKQGGLPLRAQRRIHEMSATDRPIWTSTLTPKETVVTSQTRLQAVSQVMGTSIYHVGFRSLYSRWGGGELAALTQAYEHARSLALSRMQQEAALLRAHVVLDVRFRTRDFDWSDDLIEFNAIGTAVRIEGAAPVERPALTLLEPDQLYKLQHAGYWPVGIAIGNCFWYEPHADCASEGSWFSSELPVHTRAALTARQLAVQRFHRFAAHFQAHGVVGVTVTRRGRDHEYEMNDTKHTSFHMDLVVMGTAVQKRQPDKTPPRPRLVVDLRDVNKRYGTHGTAMSTDGFDADAGDAGNIDLDE